MSDLWYVGKIGEAESYSFITQKEAEAAIVGIQLVDPEGVSQGMYYIDPPGKETDGPGEGAIYSSEMEL